MDRYALRFEVEEFLFAEADLLDRWELTAWLELFAPECEYSIPATDLPHGDPKRHTFLVHDDRFLLTERVQQLLTRTAHAEWPHSRTRRLIANVSASEADNVIEVRANFAVDRMRYDLVDTDVGQYRHLLARDEAGNFVSDSAAPCWIWSPYALTARSASSCDQANGSADSTLPPGG